MINVGLLQIRRTIPKESTLWWFTFEKFCSSEYCNFNWYVIAKRFSSWYSSEGHTI